MTSALLTSVKSINRPIQGQNNDYFFHFAFLKLLFLFLCPFSTAQARHYYQIIKRPMDLSVIRGKLNKSSHMHYFAPEEFVADVSLMFRNCAKFNYVSEPVSLSFSLSSLFFGGLFLCYSSADGRRCIFYYVINVCVLNPSPFGFACGVWERAQWLRCGCEDQLLKTFLLAPATATVMSYAFLISCFIYLT